MSAFPLQAQSMDLFRLYSESASSAADSEFDSDDGGSWPAGGPLASFRLEPIESGLTRSSSGAASAAPLPPGLGSTGSADSGGSMRSRTTSAGAAGHMDAMHQRVAMVLGGASAHATKP